MFVRFHIEGFHDREATNRLKQLGELFSLTQSLLKSDYMCFFGAQGFLAAQGL